MWNNIAEVEENIGYRFNDKELLQIALTHSSFAKEEGKGRKYNERLEFLGDSVLGLVISEFLYQHYPEASEGELSKIKSYIVSESILAEVARELKLGKYLLLSKGEEHSGGRQRTSILSDAVEAVIGAIFLDSGIKSARRFIVGKLRGKIDEAINTSLIADYKGTLQEYTQHHMSCLPVYKLTHEEGPPHQKEFQVEVWINGKRYSTGRGSSKKRAQQDAAKKAYQKLIKEKLKG